MTRFFGLLLIATPLWGCASGPLQLDWEPVPRVASAQVSSAVGEVFQLGVGQMAAVQGADLLVAFAGVANDSRCPVDVSCISAGNAEVAIGVAREGGAWTWHALHTVGTPTEALAGFHQIRLLHLRPDLRTDLPIAPSDYVAEVSVDPI